MAKKITKNIIAVKDFENTAKKIASGALRMDKEPSVYKSLFDNVMFSCDNVDELKKFIKQNKFKSKDCMHYWEGLIVGGSTLITTTYDTTDENFVENTCDNNNLIYIANWIK
ncbi:MAG: hypothetical protein JXQ23_11280 [Clostridia bacterium]|nr:hypothetical protein [Clostridia bacterium]